MKTKQPTKFSKLQNEGRRQERARMEAAARPLLPNEIRIPQRRLAVHYAQVASSPPFRAKGKKLAPMCFCEICDLQFPKTLTSKGICSACWSAHTADLEQAGEETDWATANAAAAEGGVG